MPTPTYTLIQEQVLGSAAASVTFSSIPGTYKDLVLEMVVRSNGTADYPTYRFNSDSGTNYSYTYLYGTGTAAGSGRQSSTTSIGGSWVTATASTFVTQINQIMSYANTSTFKTMLHRGDAAENSANAEVGLWRSTSAITSIAIGLGQSFATGSTFRLWGVAG